jgi:hypothetical protein
MTAAEKYDRIPTGIISGVLLPLIIAFFMFIFAKGDPTLGGWFHRISTAGMETNILSLCVFPNVLIFLLFNHFDMLRATKGVLAITIFWAVAVFLVKFLL